MNYRVTAPSGLKIRSGRGTDKEVWDVLPFGFEGEVSSITSPDPAWLPIEMEDGSIGWVSREWVELYEEEAEEAPQKPAGSPWLDIARGEVGVREISGTEDNPRILEYHAATSLKATDDETPWCSAFACWCMEQAGVRSPRSARARDWLAWGQQVNEPQVGDVAVFSRGVPGSGQGHVGFFMGRSGGSVKLLGGNQSNEVNVAYTSASRLLGYRRPA